MIKEVELNLLVPSSELLVRLASGERPLGVKAGPPRIRVLRETYFDTPEQTLRHRGMTCKLRQGEGEVPSVVVTVGEGPDSEGITSRSRLTASAVGAGVYETLKGDSEPASQIRKFLDPARLRPQIALDIQRLGRAYRTRVLRRPVLLLFFDRVTVQVGRTSSVFHEIRVRRRRRGGPLIKDVGKHLRDRYHLFPDGLSTLQRAYRTLSLEGRGANLEASPFTLNLALALFHEGKLGLLERRGILTIPTFRGSGEDAARALLDDLTGRGELELIRLGTTEPREGRPLMEVWVAPDPGAEPGENRPGQKLVWKPWHEILEGVGPDHLPDHLPDPDLLPALLLLTRRRLQGRLPWIRAHVPSPHAGSSGAPDPAAGGRAPSAQEQISGVDSLLPDLRVAEDTGASFEDRVTAVDRLASGMARLFQDEVRRLKGQILSEERGADDRSPVHLLDLLSVRVRAISDRLHEVVVRDLIPGLEERRIHLRPWSGLMHEDRRAILEEFSRSMEPHIQVVADWGPSFVPDMPPAGCAMGVTVRTRGSEVTRFFHVILGEDPRAFIRIPRSTVVLPLEEVIRGYFSHRFPALQRAEVHLFRFRTAEVTVREMVPNPAIQAREEGPPGPGGIRARFGEAALPGTENGPTILEDGHLPEPHALSLDAPTIVLETKQSVVVRILTHPTMPESHQAQLVRALERQVSRKVPLIGWSDIYPVAGPLDLKGMDELLRLG